MADAIALHRVLRHFHDHTDGTGERRNDLFANELSQALGYEKANVFRSRNISMDYKFALIEEAEPWVGLYFGDPAFPPSDFWEMEIAFDADAHDCHHTVAVIGNKVIATRSEVRFTFYDLATLTAGQSQEIFQLLSRAEQVEPVIYTQRNLQNQLEKLEQARTASDKGKAMEDLAQFLFGQIPAVKVKHIRLKTRSSEIDIVAEYNSSIAHIPLFAETGRYIVVECKNWHEKVKASNVRDFIAKIENSKCRLGVLFTRSGATGKNRDLDSEREIRIKYVTSGLMILVITLQDIEVIKSGAEFLQLLERKSAALRFDCNELSLFKN